MSAETVAAEIGLPPEQVFKTLAVEGDRNGICLAVISANQELNFKALAKQTGDRKIDMVPLKEVQALTGYIRGGVTALVISGFVVGVADHPMLITRAVPIAVDRGFGEGGPLPAGSRRRRFPAAELL